MPTYGDLKKAVAAYMTRDEEAFVRNGFNCLERAILDAQMWAQRTHIFEHAQVEITIPDVSLVDGADVSTAVLKGTATSVGVRALRTAWLPLSGASGEIPLDIIPRDTWVERQKRRWDTAMTNDARTTIPSSDDLYPLQVVFTGTKVHFTTAAQAALNGAATTDLHFDATRWLAGYSGTNDTDILTEYCFDFMIMRSVYQLNMYLKEDQRVAISDRMMNDTWLSVIRWDTSTLFHSTSPNLS